LEGKGVAVGGPEGHQHSGSPRNGDIADPIGGAGVAVQVLNGTGVSELFFDSHRDEVGVGADHVVLIGVARQGVKHAAEQVGGGFVPGDQQQNGDVEQLVIAQLALAAVVEQPAQNGVGTLEITCGQVF